MILLLVCHYAISKESVIQFFRHHFYSFTICIYSNILVSQKMEVVPTISKKSKEDTYVSWVDLAISATASIFACESSLEITFLDVDPSSDWVYWSLRKIKGFATSMMGVLFLLWVHLLDHVFLLAFQQFWNLGFKSFNDFPSHLDLWFRFLAKFSSIGVNIETKAIFVAFLQGLPLTLEFSTILERCRVCRVFQIISS